VASEGSGEAERQNAPTNVFKKRKNSGPVIPDRSHIERADGQRSLLFGMEAFSKVTNAIANYFNPEHEGDLLEVKEVEDWLDEKPRGPKPGLAPPTPLASMLPNKLGAFEIAGDTEEVNETLNEGDEDDWMFKTFEKAGKDAADFDDIDEISDDLVQEQRGTEDMSTSHLTKPTLMVDKWIQGNKQHL